MISASHNPVTYNAYKFIGQGGLFFGQKENAQWQANLTAKVKYQPHHRQGKIRMVSKQEVFDLHIKQVLAASGLKKGFKIKVALDPVGGCAREIAGYFLDQLGITHFDIHTGQTDDFPRPPEPVATSLKKLGGLVKAKQCGIGFAFDPDADRLALVGPDGKAIGEELTLPLALLSALPTRKGDVVVNLSSSHWNRVVAEQFGRKCLRSKVGEANVVALMQKHKAAFGGEGNGGVIDPTVSSLGRDSIAGMAHILRLLQKQKTSLPEIIKQLPKLSMYKQAIHLSNPNELQQLIAKVKAAYPSFIVNNEDGLHLSHKSGLPWVHIRASNTEPIVRLMAEAEGPKKLKKLLSVFHS